MISKPLMLLTFWSMVWHIAGAQTDTVLKPYHFWNEDLQYEQPGVHTAKKTGLYFDKAPEKTKGSWAHRKIFNEPLLFFNKDGIHVTADFLPDFQIGYSSSTNAAPWLNTRGVRVAGSIGTKIFFETSDFESQARFPAFVDSFVKKYSVYPHNHTRRRLEGGTAHDFNRASGRLVYMPNQYLNLELGYGTNKIGDGYRSMLLSDWAFNYPYLSVTANLKSFQYTYMLSQYVSGVNETFYYSGLPRKWGQTFYLDWNFSRNGSIGLFESVIWPDQDANNHKDLHWSMFSPVLFLHGSKSPSGQRNTTLTGLNAKYRVANKTYAYGQLAFSDLLNNDFSETRWSGQLGVRSADVFGVTGLRGLIEYNKAAPYTYAVANASLNYGHYRQALAHPLGAGFGELVGVFSYQYKKWQASLQLLGAKFKADKYGETLSGGTNIFRPMPIPDPGGTTIATDLFVADARLAYVLNPSNNLRIEVGFTQRSEKNEQKNQNESLLTIGLRSSFQHWFNDF